VATLACIYHWYTSALFVVPVVMVGGWGWWSSKRMGPGEDGDTLSDSHGDIEGPAY
jgi:hypothetical protein